MVKSLVSKLSTASNLSLPANLGGGGVQETNYLKHRNDPGRFFGDGVQFKAKLIGILEVGEARGDRMCQEALQDLKMAIRAAGEHKQRITIHVTIEGLRLRDEKTGDSLYHHPVHKISFIAQDMTDSRAFGYIFGSPDSGHRFFGIKTDKAASQVVLAMRDLFQVVFELKKKEIELARQQIQTKSLHDHQSQLASLSSLKSAVAASAGLAGGSTAHNELNAGASASNALDMLGRLAGAGGSASASGSASTRLGVNLDPKSCVAKELSPESVADLVDLEQELSSLQRGITQMERITPNDGGGLGPSTSHAAAVAAGKAASEDDPFGDSFTNFTTYNILPPPPETGRTRNKTNKAADNAGSVQIPSLLSPVLAGGSSPTTLQAQADEDDKWLHELDQQNDVFDTTKTSGIAGVMGMAALSSGAGVGGGGGVTSMPIAPLAASESTSTPTQHLSETSVLGDMELSSLGLSGTSLGEPSALNNEPQKSDAFTDLDPLGTGRTRPYVDKKYFFQELKNPPKKVLKDLTNTHASHASDANQCQYDEFLSREAAVAASASISLFDEPLGVGIGSGVGQVCGEIVTLTSASTSSAAATTNNNYNNNSNNNIAGTGIASGAAASSSSTSSSMNSLLILATTTNTTKICTCTAGNNNNNYNNNNNKNSAANSVITTNTTTNTLNTTTTTATSKVLNNTNTFHHFASSITTTTTTTTITSTSLAAANLQFPLSTAASAAAATTTIKTTTTTTTSPTTSQRAATNIHLNHYTLDAVLQATSTNSNGNLTATAATKVTPTNDDPVLLPRDTDPFSPTRKKSDPDPFQEGDLFSKLDAFEFEFGSSSSAGGAGVKHDAETTTAATTTTTIASGAANASIGSVFNGPLQVQLPPETGVTPPLPPPSAQWKGDISRLERQMSECGPSSSARSRPTPSGALAHAPPASAFKQQTVDVISSISTKKMPHLFGQARFSKRDSNSSVNMRRLQESDSLSETEAAPEPPPRPDSTPYSEPPPLPPKKQFNDIVIRPHTAVPLPTVSSGSRYEYLNNATTTSSLRSHSSGRSSSSNDMHVPPIPLPSRRVGRSDGYFPGPGRPRKPGHTEDEYLAPITGSGGSIASAGEVPPPLLPPPMSNRARTQRQQSQTKPQEIYENKAEILQAQTAAAEAATLATDITLTQLLTLGIDELAQKLNVPISKLSTMTLVELTAYLSEYLTAEMSRPSPRKSTSVSPLPPAPAALPNAAVFKVNFDHQTSFVAKFDDTFGEDLVPPQPQQQPHQQQQQQSFVANFANFQEMPTSTAQSHVPAVPPADRYAVFREIIDQELQQQQEDTDLMGDLTPPPVPSDSEEATGNELLDDDGFLTTPDLPQAPPKIDTKITEVVAQAKDRYAALRDIILVENLFDKGPTPVVAAPEKDLMHDFPEFSDEFTEDQDIRQIMGGERTSSTGPDRRGLVDSRGFPTEPSSSALTVDDDDDDDEEEEDAGAESSLDSNDKDAEAGGVQLLQDQYEKLSTSTQQLDADKPDAMKQEAAGSKADLVLKPEKQDTNFLTVTGGVVGISLTGSKDDLEIDELMQRAISNLSLDSRERTSPAVGNVAAGAAQTDVAAQAQRAATANTLSAQAHFNDVSTSPIPQQKSPQPLLKSPHAKSPQVSPVPSQLSAVSQLIDTASKQMNSAPHDSDAMARGGKESWAIFDSPKTEPLSADSRRGRHQAMKPTTRAAATLLHLPPPPPSNTSQQDTAESPCSSDPRDDGWSKNVSSTGTGRRGWHNKERQQTSSSSRDLSPWDDDTPESYSKSRRLPPGMVAPPPPPIVGTADRHGFYMRHARRMNSCDEDYDYEEDFSSRREQRKFKQGLSRSRDNFDLDSPGWYHHPAHHTWSPQDIDQGVRARSFERSAYERTTYGPPIYDKRVNAPPAPGSSSYDRRVAGYDKRGKYYRDRDREYVRPNYDYAGEYGESPPMQAYRGDMKISGGGGGRRATDYENVVYDDGRSPLGYKARGDYGMYERDRKSFDRESVESFESATRRRRSFGSGGDVYGSLDSRDEYRERYLGGSNMDLKTRSLRKPPSKLRVTGDIDYEQDSEHDFQQHHQQQHQRSNTQGRVDSRSLQRPSQLSEISSGGGGGGSSQTRLRKSSGSSPWDGEEPSLPGQKAWKRPASATETERRMAENRRAAGMVQTPPDGEKDRRFRKKTRTRSGKDLPAVNVAAPTSVAGIGPRYGMPPGGSRARDNYDYITCQDDEDIDDDEDYVDDEEYEEVPPADEDKFERLNRRRHEMHQRMIESERRQMHGAGFGKIAPPPPLSAMKNLSGSNSGASDAKRYGAPVAPSGRGGNTDYGFVDSYEQTPTPRSNASSSGGGGAVVSSAGMGDTGGGKFNFDDGFESDFNQCASPSPAPAGTASSCNLTPATTVSGSLATSAGGTTTTTATSSSKSFFRFSNDFSEREKLQQQQQQHHHHHHMHQAQNFGNLDATEGAAAAPTTTPPITQKLRFDDNVKISQFDDAAFEDDFAKASFDFDKEDASQQWQHQQLETRNNNADTVTSTTSAILPPSAVSKKMNLRTSKLQQRQELIKKSESVNIFAKKSEDPFEDDEFFTVSGEHEPGDENNANNGLGSVAVTSKSGCEKPTGGNKQTNNFQWDNDSNFAKFDENM